MKVRRVAHHRLSRIAQIQSVQVISLAPGDHLVLNLPGRLSMEQIRAARASVESLLPGIKCLVLADGAKIEALLRMQGLPQ